MVPATLNPQPLHDALNSIANTLPVPFAARHVASPRVPSQDTKGTAMILPETGRNSPDDTVSRFVATLTATAAERHGGTLSMAWARVAREAGVSSGCIEGIQRKRRKALTMDEGDKITARFIRHCEGEIARLCAELEIARAVAKRPDCDEIFEAMRAVEAARLALRSLPK
jgi:D-aminopeptidase